MTEELLDKDGKPRTTKKANRMFLQLLRNG